LDVELRIRLVRRRGGRRRALCVRIVRRVVDSVSGTRGEVAVAADCGISGGCRWLLVMVSFVCAVRRKHGDASIDSDSVVDPWLYRSDRSCRTLLETRR
jgi:hypothetical protein